MRPKAFNIKVQECYRTEGTTLPETLRLLKAAGLMSTGARGVNAPDMTPRDAARLTIALLASSKVVHVVEATKKFCALTVNHSYSEGMVPSFAKDGEQAETLEDVLTEYFSMQGTIISELSSLEVRHNEEQAVMEFFNGRALFDGDAEATNRILSEERNMGIGTVRRVPGSSMLELAVAMNATQNGEVN
ncbi:hypothetical protein [Pseudodonghicola flavimaris]|uniref:Uncharacterized protein n=1 Tax=Pseudodonghicola flavimaris TaxID=3050036 RepID=A0ABT7F5Q5_9RHOB|nr:hypothetical protein [Pseudodonghicola flavimaris]MDK3019835.1 hypothetical protein [Pseudodonghicola flavimaris]